MTYPDGQKYVGDFRDGQRHGQATVTFADGRTFIGEYRDDKRNGQGTLTLPNGEKYVGEYRNGEKNGQGISYLANGQIEASGLWANGKFAGATTTSPSPPPLRESHFPGERELPREAASPNDLMKLLYGNRLTFNNSTNCGNEPCIVKSVSNQLFDGGQHAVLVTAAEPTPKNVDHARGAVIGMAWLTHTDKGWTLDLGSPEVTTAGASGKAPDASIIDGGMWGKGVVLQHADMHQGEAERQWQLFVPDRKRGAFVSAINILTLRETSNACPVSPATAACLKDDFSSTLNVLAEKDGLAVVATVSYPAILNMRGEVKTYHIRPDNLNDSLQQPATIR